MIPVFRAIRRGHFLLLCSVFSLIIVYIYLPKMKELSVKYYEAPIFSHNSGFYEDEFYLNIEAPMDGMKIYYTLDGSEPSLDSFVYTEPLLIDNASLHENTYSTITDVSAGFRTDLIEQYETAEKAPGYMVPDFLVDKCTIVRAVAYAPGEIKSDMATATYFVGTKPQDFEGCNIVSIISSPDNLFDAETGIYVTGNVFEDYLSGNENIDEDWRNWRSNYRQRGKEWEREAYIQIFNEKGELFVSDSGGMRTRGGISRGTLPRGINFYFKDDNVEEDNKESEWFDNGYVPVSISLSSGGNQLITLFSDYMMAERTKELNYAQLKFKPCVMFLDGEYWGFYWLTEKYDEHFFEYYYDVDADSLVMMKTDDVEIGNDKDAYLFDSMKEYIVSHDMSNIDNYCEACDLVDINSLVDYYATMIYIARSEDWPKYNFALWRTKSETGKGFEDGKWRWIMFDCNSAAMQDDMGLTEQDTLSYVLEKDTLFASLWDNESFRELFKERIMYIADECFAAADMTEFIDDYRETMEPILSKSWSRFYGSQNDKKEQFYRELKSYNDFFAKRKKVVENWWQN